MLCAGCEQRRKALGTALRNANMSVRSTAHAMMMGFGVTYDKVRGSYSGRVYRSPPPRDIDWRANAKPKK